MSSASVRVLVGPALCAAVVLSVGGLNAQAQQVGIFTGHQDVGKVLHPGAAQFDSAKDTYAISGNGENMWFGMDDFHFAWKKMSGDVSLTAGIDFIGATGNNHRKAVLMIRQSLEGTAAAVDLAVHGDGLTSLQFHAAASGETREVRAMVVAPHRVRIVKRGDAFFAFVPGKDGKLVPGGPATRLVMTGEFYVGIGVCSHDKDATEQAVFSHVKLEQLAVPKGRKVLLSTLETVETGSNDRHTEYATVGRMEAPRWTADGALEFMKDAKLWSLARGSVEPVAVADDAAQAKSEDWVSPDGAWRVTVAAEKDANGNVEIRLTDTKTRQTKVQARVGGGAGKIGLPAWAPDSKRIAFVSYAKLPAEDLSAQ